MKMQRNYIILFLTVVILSIIGIIISKSSDVFLSISSGFFTGSLVVLVQSIITYQIERRRTLENFYFSVIKTTNFLSDIVYVPVDTPIDKYLLVYDYYKKVYNEHLLSELYGFRDICFFWDFMYPLKLSEKIHEEIYLPLVKILDKIIAKREVFIMCLKTEENYDLIKATVLEIQSELYIFSKDRVTPLSDIVRIKADWLLKLAYGKHYQQMPN